MDDSQVLDCRKGLEALGHKNLLLTDSCTRALEIAAYLLELEPGDEVIVPSYGYVSTADAFAKQGAEMRFADSLPIHPNVDPDSIASLIGPRTKAVVVIHYGGFRCDMKTIKAICEAKGVVLIEDNAHGIGVPLHENEIVGDLAALSFHQTKNIHCFSGGALEISQDRYLSPALTYFDKGTDKAAFLQGAVPYYQWVGHGNASAMSALNSAFLSQQMELLDEVTEQRKDIWNRYQKAFNGCSFNVISDHVAATGNVGHNAHIYALLFENADVRDRMQAFLKERGVQAYVHYNALHRSQQGVKYGSQICVYADRFSNGLLRLPVYAGMTNDQVDWVIESMLAGTQVLYP